MRRRQFLKRSVGIAGAVWVLPGCESRETAAPGASTAKALVPSGVFNVSLAQWSLHRTIRAGDLDQRDFPAVARREFGLDAIEWVNQFFMDRARDADYIGEMKRRADGEGVRSLLIMCDGEGDLGNPDDAARTTAVENHFKWVEAAKALGCHSIRVNAASQGSFDEQMRLAADGLRRLTEFADGHELNVIVENHGGLSSSGRWLSGVMEMVGHDRCGTLPDFGNFCIRRSESGDCEEEYDRYQGVAELMPHAKAVSAKSHDFDEDGNETRTDYTHMMRAVLDAGYRGYVGIEYEGDALGEREGISATLDLLLKVREELAAEYS